MAFEREYKNKKIEKWLAIGIIGACMFWISFIGAAVYAAFHFLQKYW